MNTALYAMLHFFVDMVCAWAMFSNFTAANYENLLIYNFCAFVLQMPLGTLLDLFDARVRSLPLICAAIGTLLTTIGALIHPALLGLGNALFHVGGGIDVIGEDFAACRRGSALGFFVAPGAIGLYAGTCLGKHTDHLSVLLIAVFLMSALLIFLFLLGRSYKPTACAAKSTGKGIVILTLCCFLVVVLRSWVGLAVSFDWKSVPLYAVLTVFAVAFGKFCGGLVAVRFGLGETAAVTLLLAALCYLAADIATFGLLALFLFNMCMPLTLYLLVRELPHLPGFSFGLLTFGLFLGFLPVYAGVELPISDEILGAVGSLISAILLFTAERMVRRGSISV